MRSPVRIWVAAPDNPEANASGLWFFIDLIELLKEYLCKGLTGAATLCELGCVKRKPVRIPTARAGILPYAEMIQRFSTTPRDYRIHFFRVAIPGFYKAAPLWFFYELLQTLEGISMLEDIRSCYHFANSVERSAFVLLLAVFRKVLQQKRANVQGKIFVCLLFFYLTYFSYSVFIFI